MCVLVSLFVTYAFLSGCVTPAPTTTTDPAQALAGFAMAVGTAASDVEYARAAGLITDIQATSAKGLLNDALAADRAADAARRAGNMQEAQAQVEKGNTLLGQVRTIVPAQNK